MADPKARGIPWRLCLREMVGTGALLIGGLSAVIFMLGKGSPLAVLLPNEGARRAITGFLFGSSGALTALSPVGKVSGAHIKPAVTLAFWLVGKLHSLRSCPIGRRVHRRSTAPGVGRDGPDCRFRRYCPGRRLFHRDCFTGRDRYDLRARCRSLPFYRVAKSASIHPGSDTAASLFHGVGGGADIGNQLQPARTLGPAIISGRWEGWWIFWVGPALGALAATLACSFLAKEIEVAKLYQFDSDHDGLFRRMGRSGIRV
jgi:aquaporin Z